MACSISSKISVKTIEKCHIYPSIGDSCSSIPLTFLDIPWLLFPPSQPLFFFQLPPSSSPSFFTSDVVPKLKFSLSSALECFPYFATRLTVSSKYPGQIALVLDETVSPSVPLTIGECNGDGFASLCSDISQMDANDLHQLVPELPSQNSFGLESLGLSPLLAVQITCFPSGPGFSIGLAYHRVVSDERTFNNFIHSWASYCKLGHIPPELKPSFDRSVIIDSAGLHPILLKQFWDSKQGSIITPPLTMGLGLVRSTFVMGLTDIQNAKKWILAQCGKKNRPKPVLLSPYVVTCAFVWACLVRAQMKGPGEPGISKGPMYFGFIAGGITRLSYPVPISYFGNCVGFGRAVASREELLSEDGMLVASDAIGQTIKELDRDMLGQAVNWISEWEPIIGSDWHVSTVGSPKVNIYEVDFGWGNPKKVEENSIDVMRGVSLRESREMKGGMEIGMTLPKCQMDAFLSLFNQGLLDFSM